MKTNFLAIALFSTVISCSAQQIQNRPVTDFDKIQTSGSVSVFYTDSDSLSLTVKAKANELDNIETKVVNSTLVISSKGNFREPVSVYVKNNKLSHIESSGATDFTTTNALRGDEISFSISGSAEVHATVNAKKVKAVLSGASDLALYGTTDYFDVETAGASTVRSYSLVSKDANVVTSGATEVKVYATERIKANATGASEIKIKGDAKDVNADATSAASIMRIENHLVATDTTSGDSTVFHWKHKKIIIINTMRNRDDDKKKTENGYEENDFKHWVGFAIGVNGYMGQGGGINLPSKDGYMDLNYGRSFNFQLNIIERQFNLVKNSVKIITGIGLDFHMYELANKTKLNADSSFTFGQIDSTNTYSYKKNKLRNTYIQVPLLLEFNTNKNPEKTFHIAFGVIGQYLIASRTKQVIEEDRYTIKRVRKDGYNMSPFAAKAHVNMGYRGWTIFAEYSLTPLFQSGKGPELYPFTVGLRVIPFA